MVEVVRAIPENVEVGLRVELVGNNAAGSRGTPSAGSVEQTVVLVVSSKLSIWRYAGSSPINIILVEAKGVIGVVLDDHVIADARPVTVKTKRPDTAS